MKHIMLSIAILAGGTAAFGQSTKSLATDLQNLSWLEGTWTRTNNKPGRTGQEYWTKISDSEWRGLGVTLNGKDTAFVERLKLVIRNNTVNYVADIKENKEATYFQLTKMSTTGFVCENPMHDFPKKIAYQLEGKILKATISGNGKSVDYYFEKK